eukprot:TRINITY_DN2912_c0_g2_i4.p1 TRINITY_DN2912_c0_g2~~TRINITY_DN2912_c0_g2_i4.p1  ORF type:complete len:255 (-),score=7.21 TRINITY_DN2912_c0_g2_i4:87-851(-)
MSRFTDDKDSKEIKELLSGDEGLIDIGRLRQATCYGVSAHLRAEVWKYLLAVSKLDSSEEILRNKKAHEEYLEWSERATDNLRVHDSFSSHSLDSETLRQIRNDIRDFHPEHEFFRDRSISVQFETIMITYLRFHPDVQYHSRYANYLGVLLYCLKDEADTFYCFCNFVTSYDYYVSSQGFAQLLSKFLMLFRTFHAELCALFEDEEISPNQWAVPWLHVPPTTTYYYRLLPTTTDHYRPLPTTNCRVPQCRAK